MKKEPLALFLLLAMMLYIISVLILTTFYVRATDTNPGMDLGSIDLHDSPVVESDFEESFGTAASSIAINNNMDNNATIVAMEDIVKSLTVDDGHVAEESAVVETAVKRKYSSQSASHKKQRRELIKKLKEDEHFFKESFVKFYRGEIMTVRTEPLLYAIQVLTMFGTVKVDVALPPMNLETFFEYALLNYNTWRQSFHTKVRSSCDKEENSFLNLYYCVIKVVLQQQSKRQHSELVKSSHQEISDSLCLILKDYEDLATSGQHNYDKIHVALISPAIIANTFPPNNKYREVATLIGKYHYQNHNK